MRFGDAGPVVVDGPFNEAKEIVGGFTVLDVPDMDAALEIARCLAARWSSPVSPIEIRPMVEDYSQFEG